MEYGGNMYYYQYNLQGDVTGLYDSNFNLVVTYLYDAYGYNYSINSYETIGNINPFRYRGYLYDEETGFYYLNSRYYDPETGRFINADDFVSTGVGIVGTNMFAYCLNNPINMVDYDGDIPRWAIVGVIHLGITLKRNGDGWAWYYTVKSIISLAGTSYLSSKGYSLSRAMFYHGMWGYGRTPSSSTKNLLISRLKSSTIMNNCITNAIKSAKGNSININGTVEFIGNNLVNTDLYYSVQHVSYNIKGTKFRGRWTLRITVSDYYNFDNIRSFSKLSFGNAANDLGWAMQRIGMMTPYKISVSYIVRR